MVKVTEKIQVDVLNLKEGMYVSDLDRPWVGSPFALQGFMLNNEKDIKKLQRLCKHVYVDVPRSMKTVIQAYQEEQVKAGPVSNLGEMRVNINKGNKKVLDIHSPTEAKVILGKGGSITELPQPPVISQFKDELRQARRTYERLKKEITRICDAIDNNEKAVFLPILGMSIEVVSSIKRNDNALQWLAVTDPDNESIPQHCVNACIMSVKLGHYIGLPDNHLRQLAIGGLTYDIGKLIIADEIRNKSSKLTPEEMGVMQKHVMVGAEMLEEIGDIVPPESANVCWKHHEKIDGSGYPKGIKGEEIDLLSRIVAIVDAYSAITSRRSHSQSYSPSRALDELYKLRDKSYDAELVEAFIRCNGMYPIGTVIETQTGEIGVVVSNDMKNKLSPSILMLYDEERNKLPEETIINFATNKNSQGKQAYNIKRSLNPSEHDIDLQGYLKD